LKSGLRALFCAAEIYPMAKTGGLGDVAAALPAALREAGTDIRLLMPAYRSALASVTDAAPVQVLGDINGCGPTDVLLGSAPQTGLPVYLIRNQRLFERDGGPYHDARGRPWPDNAERFAVLCRAAAAVATDGPGGWRPELVHVNDWHTALIPSVLGALGAPVASVLTIHNAAYQEPLTADMQERLGIPTGRGELHAATPSFLSAGIAAADRLTTVSPTYAKEIQTPQFGCGLERLLAARAAVLRGILNGIDVAVWNPHTDEHIAQRYSERDLSGKAGCKRALCAEMGLAPDSRKPLLACVSRLTPQKGLDVLLAVLPQLLAADLSFVVLGTGDRALESGFTKLAERHPGCLAVRIAYDEALAHRIVAGADLFVMPSRFEPCGLNQMYSQRYGTIPIVHPVGGLADTVRDAADGDAGGEGTGFFIAGLSPAKLAATASTAVRWYHDTPAWQQLQRNGMKQDFSWKEPARAYADVYRAALRSG